jgi:hypothetical protein
MLDVFAFLLPLVMMVLWFAGQNRTKQADHEVAEMANVTYLKSGRSGVHTSL